MAALIGLLVFIAIFWMLTKNLPSRPNPETESELRAQGLNTRQAKQEARAQRNEVRYHQRTIGQSMRTAERMGRFARRLAKKG